MGSRAAHAPRQRPRRSWFARAVLIVLVLALLPLLILLPLRWLPPPTSSFMLQAKVAGLGEAGACPELHYQWVPWQGISDQAKLAVIASEDQRFAQHWGIDLQSIGNALQESDQTGRLRGASTISQQVAKNLFLWSGRSWLRKSMEAYLALLMELAWPKQRILEVYLNIAQFDTCTFGVQAAASRFFQRDPARLTSRQGALLAAVLPSPARLRADRPSTYVEQRVAWIQAQMRQLGGASYLDQL